MSPTETRGIKTPRRSRQVGTQNVPAVRRPIQSDYTYNYIRKQIIIIRYCVLWNALIIFNSNIWTYLIEFTSFHKVKLYLKNGIRSKYTQYFMLESIMFACKCTFV